MNSAVCWDNRYSYNSDCNISRPASFNYSLFTNEELRTVTNCGYINLLFHVSAFVESYHQAV